MGETDAANIELVAEIEARYPNLDIAGFPGGYRNGRYPKLSEDQCGFAIALAFIQAGAPGGYRHRDGCYGSFGLKHAAERWTETADTVGYDYVGNGAMIAAAAASGWSVKPEGINARLKPPKGWRRARSVRARH